MIKNINCSFQPTYFSLFIISKVQYVKSVVKDGPFPSRKGLQGR